MNTNVEPSAMRRKAGAGRPRPEIGQLTPARALRAGLAQAAQDVAMLVAVAGNVEEARATRERVVEGLPEFPLIGLVEGPEGRFGLMILDPQTVAALIEMQTTGRVVPRAAEPRAPTRTDAIMCADFIDRVLELVEAQLVGAELAIAPVFAGFRYAMALSEARSIAMTLDDVAYRVLSLSVDFGHGAKAGQIQLVLPFDPPGQGARGGGDGAAFTEALRVHVLATEAVLTATLARREMTLAEVTRLAVGMTIPLPDDALNTVEIEDMSRRVVARGRLGQAEGHRAVRILADGDGVGRHAAGQSGYSGPGPALQIAPPDMRRTGPGADRGLDALGGLDGLGGAEPLAPVGGMDDSGPGAGGLAALGDTDFAGLADLPDGAGLADLGSFSNTGT